MKKIVAMLLAVLLLGAGCAPVEPESSAVEPVVESSAAESSEDEVSESSSEGDRTETESSREEDESESSVAESSKVERPADPPPKTDWEIVNEMRDVDENGNGFITFPDAKCLSTMRNLCLDTVWVDESNIVVLMRQRQGQRDGHTQIVLFNMDTQEERLLWEGEFDYNLYWVEHEHYSMDLNLHSDGEYVYYTTENFEVCRIRLSDGKKEIGSYFKVQDLRRSTMRNGWVILQDFEADPVTFTVNNAFTGESFEIKTGIRRADNEGVNANGAAVEEWSGESNRTMVEFSPTGKNFLVYRCDFKKYLSPPWEETFTFYVFDFEGNLILEKQQVEANYNIDWVWDRTDTTIHVLANNNTEKEAKPKTMYRFDIAAGTKTVYEPPEKIGTYGITSFILSSQGDFYLYWENVGDGGRREERRTKICCYDCRSGEETVIYHFNEEQNSVRWSYEVLSPDDTRYLAFYTPSTGRPFIADSEPTFFRPLLVNIPKEE